MKVKDVRDTVKIKEKKKIQEKKSGCERTERKRNMRK